MNQTETQKTDIKPVPWKWIVGAGIISVVLSGFMLFAQITRHPAGLVGEVLSISNTEIQVGHARNKIATVIVSNELSSQEVYGDIEIGMFVRVTGEWEDKGVYRAQQIDIAHKQRK